MLSVVKETDMNVPSSDNIWKRLYSKCGRTMDIYDFRQENGQRKLTIKLPPRGAVPPFSPPEGTEIFVGRLPRDLFEDELLPPFMSIGQIFELRLMMNFSGGTRGFAFVKYFTVKNARAAIEKLNNHEIRRRHRIGVLPSMNHRNLFIGPLLDLYPFTLQEGDVHQLLEEMTPGIEKVTILKYMYDRIAWYPFKGMLVQYKTHRDAALARRVLIPKKNMVFGDLAEIDWASPEILSRARMNFIA